MILTQQLNTNASKNLAKAAYRYLGKEMNYSEFKARIAKLSYLYLHEIGDHARIAIIARNSPATLASFFAFTNTRALTIPIDPDRSPEEITAWLKESKPTHIAVTNDLIGKVRDIQQNMHINLPLIEIEKKQGGEYASSFTAPPDNQPADTDPIVLFRTGGATGKPKFVTMNHKQLLASATALRSSYKITASDRFYTRMNWAHPFAFVHSLLGPMMLGATCVIDHGAEGKDLLDFLVESRVSRLIGLPPFFLKILLVCRDEKRRIPAAVRSVIVGLGPLSAEVRKTIGLMKIPVCHCYGMTEAGWTIAMEGMEEKEDEKPNSFGCGHYVGRGLPGFKYKVVDRGGDEIPGREQREGLLAVSGPAMMTGYMDNEKETKQAIRGTWLYTNEFARLEGEGEDLKITFLSRREDAIWSESGITIATAIDQALKGLPGIMDAAGFILKDSKNELRFAVAVVRTPAAANLNEKQILDHCASHISGDMMPVAAVFTDFIPRDGGGNVNRYKLRAQFSGAVG